MKYIILENFHTKQKLGNTYILKSQLQYIHISVMIQISRHLKVTIYIIHPSRTVTQFKEADGCVFFLSMQVSKSKKKKKKKLERKQ